MMPTIKDVAKAANVSIATVSYVLNNRTEMVGEKTRLHVLATAQHLGYRPNIVARNLQSSRTRLVGYAWHRNPVALPTSVMDQFIYHLAQAAEAQHYHLLTFTYPDGDPLAVYEELMRSGRVDGFIVAETEQDDPRIAYLLKQCFPFVSFGRANPDWVFDWVDTDGRAGTRMATEHLLRLGHRQIAFLGWPRTSLTGNYRLEGYLEAMSAAGIATPEGYVLHHDYNHNSLEDVFAGWQARPADEHPTALVAVSDVVAVAAMQTAEQVGFQIGKTLSVVGFDDAPFVSYLRPGLTTLHQPFDVISTILMRRLDALISGDGGYDEPMTQLITPELVVRGSSGQPLAVAPAQITEGTNRSLR
ncbi:MAG: LacI family DNA-binding transcriptional regulator [Armatimonadetes bacterium]|nr:LacI family DNA-binding transcriptional regulator [Anaerolineae bacterium]